MLRNHKAKVASPAEIDKVCISYVLNINGGQFSISIPGLNWIFSLVSLPPLLGALTLRPLWNLVGGRLGLEITLFLCWHLYSWFISLQKSLVNKIHDDVRKDDSSSELQYFSHSRLNTGPHNENLLVRILRASSAHKGGHSNEELHRTPQSVKLLTLVHIPGEERSRDSEGMFNWIILCWFVLGRAWIIRCCVIQEWSNSLNFVSCGRIIFIYYFQWGMKCRLGQYQ